jgi:3-hydroxyacyl-CoA dehydrogenase
MGLYLMHDMAGHDVSWRGRQYREALRDKSHRYSTIADRRCELGRSGQKTGKGYCPHEGEEAGAKVPADPDVEALIWVLEQVRHQHVTTARSGGPQ